MMVDHRAVLLLADAYRYNQLKKTKLSGNKVNKAPKVVSSNASNVREDSDKKQNVDKRMSRLKQSGHIKDAQSVLKEMYFNEQEITMAVPTNTVQTYTRVGQLLAYNKFGKFGETPEMDNTEPIYIIKLIQQV